MIWLLALIPTLDLAAVTRELRTAAGGLPVLLWLFAALGMLWADATLAERIAGLGGFHKLLVIPLLLAQFRRSERGILVLYGFLVSCDRAARRVLALTRCFQVTLVQSDSGQRCPDFRRATTSRRAPSS